MKFIIPAQQKQNCTTKFTTLHKTAKQSAQRAATCCTIKFIEKLNFLCVLVLLNRRKMHPQMSIQSICRKIP